MINKLILSQVSQIFENYRILALEETLNTRNGGRETEGGEGEKKIRKTEIIISINIIEIDLKLKA